MSDERFLPWAKAKQRGDPYYRSYVDCVHCETRNPLRLMRSRECYVCHAKALDNGTYYKRNKHDAAFKAKRAERARNRRAIAKLAPALRIYLQSFQASIPQTKSAKKEKTMARACQHKANAKKAGRPTYTTGVKCEECQTDKRYVVSGNCVECAKQANRRFSKTEKARLSNAERQARYRERQKAHKLTLLEDI